MDIDLTHTALRSPLRVFMILPYLGQVEDKSRRAAYLTASRTGLHIHHRPSPASLLAYGLNMKWAEMESGRSDDGSVSGIYDYCAILHADCCPDYWWVDTCLREMNEHNLDCIHAVCAIKTDDALSSTAYGSIHNQASPIRKLSLKEIHERLPSTFTIDDVVGALGTEGFDPKDLPIGLFPNTGVFVLKVSPDGKAYYPWVSRFPGFHIQDWFDRQEGKPTKARVVSEDWHFGRWAAKEGLRVGGTRALVVKHIGPSEYSNEYPDRKVSQRDEGFFRLQADWNSRGRPARPY